MDMPEGAEGHSVASDGVGALIEGPKVAISQTRLYLDGAPGLYAGIERYPYILICPQMFAKTTFVLKDV